MKKILFSLLLLPHILFAQLVSDFQVNDPDTVASDNANGSIGVDSEGNYIIVWTDRRTGRPNVYCQMYNNLSNKIGVNFRINVIPDTSSRPDIAVFKNGNFAICWSQLINNERYINCKLYNKAGNPISGDIRLNDSTSGLYGASKIVVSSRGYYIVTWDHRPNTLSKEIVYYQIIDSLGNKIGTNRIAGDLIFARMYNPSIAVLQDNRFVITWQDERFPGGASIEDVYYQMFDPDGNKIGGNVRVYNDTLSYGQRFPIASSDSLNRLCICFSEFDFNSSKFLIRCQLFNSDGSKNGEDFVVSPFSTDQYLRAIVKRNDGKIVVGFDKGFVNNIPYFQRLDSSGIEIGEEYEVSMQFQNFSKSYSDIAVYKDKIISVWNDSRYGNSDVFCNVRSFSNPDSTVGISQISNNVPDDFRLFQNYPNPFNNSTNIKFSIREKGFTKLAVFDLLGRELDLIEYGIREPGSYTINYNSDKLSSGVYFYRIEAGSFIQTKRMVLVK